MFTNKDLQQIQQRGSSVAVVEQQIKNFKSGFPYMEIRRPATIGNGLMQMTDQQKQTYISLYEQYLAKGATIVKFVPASGAATRMFKNLFEFISWYKGTADDQAKYAADQSTDSVARFFDNIHSFAFVADLRQAAARNGYELDQAIAQKEYVKVLKTLLNEDGLNYGNLPKGLLKFHKYPDGARTPVEEHLVEAARYAASQGKAKVHFTVSPEHRKNFVQLIDAVKAKYEKLFDVRFDIDFSEQQASTDTIAVDMNNEPFRDDDGSLLFRPAGHGALIANLNEISADVIFVKNIDNVVPDHLKDTTYEYKKALAGLLLEYQQTTFAYLNELEKGAPSAQKIAEIHTFVEKILSTDMGSGFAKLSASEQAQALQRKLNRPIRVCGMVRNEGDPGGGPFWSVNPDGSVSLQIVETAQIDLKNEAAKAVFQQSSHFNPVDLICGVKDYKGKAFDLTKYVDPATGFISKKSKSGRDLKAQELPGLWNGAMSDWNTVFVEAPVITFNPVKTVNDLLRKQHQ